MQSSSLSSRSQILKANAASPTGALFCFFLLCTEVAALAPTEDAVPLCTLTEAESSATGGINGFFFQCEIKFRHKSYPQFIIQFKLFLFKVQSLDKI